MRLSRTCLLILLAAAGLTGCKQNPFVAAGPAAPGTATASNNSLFGSLNNTLASTNTAYQEANQALSTQLKDLNTQISQLDANNRDLTSQVAQAEQAREQMQSQIALLQKQLGDSGTQMKELQNLKDEAEKRAEAILASAKARGGAILSANSSVKQNLQAIQIPGIEVHPEGEVVRLELPADRLFGAGGLALTQEGAQLVDSVAASVLQSYPKQRIVIEGHTDNALLAQAGASHLLSGSQAQAVFQQLVSRNQFRPEQLSIAAMGANHPRASNATPAGKAKNRRVEVVIYPDGYAG